MSRRLLGGTLVLFAVWVLWKVLPFLDQARPAIWATPTVQPIGTESLAPVAVRGGDTICLDGVMFGPKARYVYVTVLPGRRLAPAIDVEATAPGYRATTTIRAGLDNDDAATVPITPATREVPGKLCLTNTGRHQIAFYGTNPGRGTTTAITTIEGTPLRQQISVTILESPSASLTGRLGEVFDHMAAFRPFTGWEVWILFALLMVGAPVAVAVALARAAAQDDAPHDGT